ncbi:MAG: phosphopantetheine-binding protein [Phycisphaerae bacterium]
MTKLDLCNELSELMELDDTLTVESDLTELEEYDSMALLSIIAFVDKNFGKTLKADQLAQVVTVQSLIDIIGLDAFSD